MTGLLTQRWEVMASLSSAGFAVRNLGLKTVRGQVPILDAWVDVDSSERPVAASARLDLAAVATGNARRDRDLRGPNLLDTARYPVLAFTSNTIEAGEAGWQVHGTLSAHGQDIEIVLAVEAHEQDSRRVVHAAANFDRRDLGICAPRLLISARIEVELRLVFRPVD